MKVTMTLEGMDSVQRALIKAPDVTKRHASGAVQTTASATANRARVLAPVRTGTLKSMIVADRTARGLTGRVGIAPGIVNGKRPSRYWHLVEFGTVHAPAQPFFRPAADLESDDFIRRMRAIGPAIERDLSAGRFL